MIKGKIIDINADGNAIIQAPIDTYIFTHRKVKEAYIDYIDSRPLSDKQRRMCYALINAIAEWSGETAEGTKTALKLDFLAKPRGNTCGQDFQSFKRAYEPCGGVPKVSCKIHHG